MRPTLLPTLALATAILSAAAPAPIESVAELRTMMRQSHSEAVQTRLTAMIDAAAEAGDRTADPRLDSLLGWLSARTAPEFALPLLDRALAAPQSPSERGLLRVARAEALDGIDQSAAALRDATALAADTAMPIEARRDADYFLGRLLLRSDPAGARSAANAGLALASTAGDRWEGHLLESRAEAQLGLRAEADSAAAAAWAEAPAADPGMLAIERTASDLAIARWDRGDPASVAGLIAIGTRQPFQAGELLNYLPACGAAIGADDYVVFELTATDAGSQINVVRSSRPNIADLFLLPIRRTAMMRPGGSEAVSTIALRCRKNREPLPLPSFERQIALTRWVIASHIYPGTIATTADDELDGAISLAQERVATVSARFGADGLALFGPTSRLAEFYSRKIGQGEIRYIDPYRETVETMRAIAVKAAAPANVLAAIDDMAPPRFDDGATAEAKARAGFDRAIAMAGNDPGKILLVRAAADIPRAPLAFRTDTLNRVAQALTAAGSPPTGPAAQAIAAARADLLQESGDAAGAARLRTAARLDLRRCGFADVRPARLEDAIKSEDYPPAYARASLTGLVNAEFDVDATGAVSNVRAIYSSPALVFEPVTIDRLRVARAEPAQRAGKPIACIGSSRTVRWQLPDDDQSSAPRLSGIGT